MSTEGITGKELRRRGWEPSPALGRALKVARELLEKGKPKHDILAALDNVLAKPDAYLYQKPYDEVARLLTSSPLPKRSNKVVGNCQICGKKTVLSFEHVPPQSAFNKATVIAYELESKLIRREDKGVPQQGGFGRHTLCVSCNTNTGSWYADEYVKWARIGMSILASERIKGKSEVFVRLKDVYPLRFLKQVATCFFTIIGVDPSASFAANNSQLVDFVLDKYSRELPPNIRFFMRLNHGTALRRHPIAAKIPVTVAKDEQGHSLIKVSRPPSIFSEMTHPPFALIMTEDTDFPDASQITGFTNYGYDECVDLTLQLKIGRSTTPLPGDYRPLS